MSNTPNYWKSRVGILKDLLEQGYTMAEHPTRFLKEFPGKSPGAISRAIRRHCKDLTPVVLEDPEVTAAEVRKEVERDVELQRMKSEKRATQRKYNAILKGEAQFDRMTSFLRDSILIRPTVKVPPPFNINTTKTRKPLAAVIDLSDIHHGDVVDRERTMGLGDFDRAMSRGRLAMLAEKTILITKSVSGHDFSKAVVNLLGDIVSGDIHEELVQFGDGVVTDWVYDIAITLALFILDLAREFPVVEVNGISGNHGRMSKKPNFKADVTNNWDMVAYQIISLILEDQPNVVCHFPKSFAMVVDINHFSSLLLHGQYINSYYGVPYYGIMRTASKLGDLVNINLRRLRESGAPVETMVFEKSPTAPPKLPFRYIEMGHFHTSALLNNSSVEIIMNGSVVGNSEYNLTKLAVGQEPKQWLLFAHPDEGYTARWPINLIGATRKMGVRYGTDESLSLGERVREARART